MTLRLARRWLARFWASPYTILGLTIGLLLRGRFCTVDGVIEICGPRIAAGLRRMWVPAQAMTLGHVVLGRDETTLAVTRRHERVHVAQYARWGIAFVPAYLACFVWLQFRGRDGYRDNPFEIEAFAVDSFQES